MRILSISQNHYVAGGMDRVVFDQLRILEEHGHEVIPFAAADPADSASQWAGYFPAANRTDATTVAELPRTLWRLRAAHALEHLLASQAFDIVHLHSWYKRLSPAILPVLRRSAVPVVHSLHDYRTVCSRSTLLRDGKICLSCKDGRRWPALRHRCNGSIAKTLASLAEMRIAALAGYDETIHCYLPVSEFQRDALSLMGLPADRMRTLPNPVAIPAEPAPPPAKDAAFLFTGRIESYKGADLFAALAKARPSRSFVMAGDGTLRAAIEKDAPSNLRLVGQLDRSALAAHIAGAACVVVPSLAPETFGLAAAEALALGRPVIASRIGGLPEIVRDDIDGILVAPGDFAGFASALDRIETNPAAARAMGMAGRERIEQVYSEKRYYERLLSVYSGVLDIAPRRSGRAVRS